MTTAPLLLTGGIKVIIAWPSPIVAVPIVGASGALANVIVLLAPDATLVPALFVAVIVNE